MTLALDPDYETVVMDGMRWEVQYYWPDRVWRRVLCSRLAWGCVPRVNPDAALAPEVLPGEQATSVREARRLVARSHKTECIYQALVEMKEGTAADLAQVTGIHIKSIQDHMARHTELFRKTGAIRLPGKTGGREAAIWRAI